MVPIPWQRIAPAVTLVILLSGCASSHPNPVPVAFALPSADPDHPPPRDTVVQALYDGWKQYVLLCERCHGEDALGTSFAPSLVAALRPDGAIATADRFVELMRSGRTDKGMPAAATLGLDTAYFAGLYQYLKARSDGVLRGGRPARRER